MEPDPGLEPTRAIREKISAEHGNDPRRLIEHYIEYQIQFADRLRWAVDSDPATALGAEPAAAADGAARRS